MNFLGTIALGYIQEQNKIMQEASAAKSEEAKLSAAFSRDKQLIDYRVTKENEQAESIWEREANKRKDDAFMDWFGNLDEDVQASALTSESVLSRLEEITGAKLSSDIARTANAMADADTVTVDFGGLSIDVADNYKEKLNDSNLGVRSATWFNPYQEMAANNPDKFVAALKDDENLRETFFAELESYGNFHNIFMANEMANKTTGETRGYIGFEKSYSSLMEVLTEAGYDIPGTTLKAAKTAILKNAVDKKIVTNPSNAIVIRAGDAIKPIEIEDQTLLKNMNALATRSGFESLQAYVDDLEKGFSFLVPEGETVEEVYSVLFNAADYQGNMYHLAVQGKGSTETLANFGDDLIEDYGRDRLLMAQTTSLLIKPKKIDTMASQATLTREGKDGAFKKATGYTISEVQTGYQAGIKLQNQMATLAEGVTEAGTTGFVRYVQAIGISIVGEGGSLDQIFNSEEQGNLYLGDDGQVNPNHPKYTTQTMLQNTASNFFGKEKGEALSKIEAAKVALAIAMARAADPAGRLSNQDFEVQLGRLGQTGFFGDTLPQMKKKLQLISEEFARDLRRTELLNTYANDEAITPETLRILEGDRQVQRAVDASTLRTLRSSRQDRANEKEDASVSMENYTEAGYTDINGKEIFIKINDVKGPTYVYADGSDATNAEFPM